jgi:TolA-binding protein
VELGPNADLSAVLHEEDTRPGYLLEFGGRGNRASRILCNGVDLVQSSEKKARIVPARRYHIVAEHVGQFVKLSVDYQEVLRLRDFFPLSGGRAGLYSWGAGARFDNVRLSRRRQPPPASSLSEADKLYLAQDYVGANKLYVAFRAGRAEDSETRLALYKSGLSLLNQSDTDGARSAFEMLKGSDLAPWTELALADVEARAGKGDEAVKRLRAVSASADPDAAALIRSSIIYLGLKAPASHGVDAAVPILSEAKRFLPDWQYEWLANETAGTGDYTRTHGRIDLAVNYYAAAIRAFPDVRAACADSLLGLGLASIEHAPDKPEIAAKAFERVISEYPEEKELVATAREKLAELRKKTPPAPGK